MKLNLRFLLAYMDDILRPADAREVGRLLSENANATEVVARVREVIRMRRLSAPAVAVDDPGADANDVAEYLDNLLAPEQLREFEQQCLNSDERLAEVGASHQILTLILGGGRPMPESTRSRLLEIAGHIADTEEQVSANMLTAASKADAVRLKSGVVNSDIIPALDYRRSRTSARQLLVALGILLLTGGWFYSIYTDPSFRYQSEAVREGQLAASGNNDLPDNEIPVNAIAEVEENVVAAGKNEIANELSDVVVATSLNGPNMKGNVIANENSVTASPSITGTELAQVAPADKAVMPDSVNLQDNINRPNAVPPVGPAVMPANPTPANPAVGQDQPAVAVVAPVMPPEPICLKPGIIFVAGETPVIVNLFGQNVATIAKADQPVQAGDQFFTPRYSQGEWQLGNEQAFVRFAELSSAIFLGADELSCFGLELYQGRFYFQLGAATDPNRKLTMRLVIHHQAWYVDLPTQATAFAVEVQPNYASHFEQIPAAGPLLAELWVAGAPVSIGQKDELKTAIDKHITLLPLVTMLPQPADLALQPEAALLAAQFPDWFENGEMLLTTSQKRDQRDFGKLISNSSNLWLDLQGIANDPNPRIAALAVECLALGQDYDALDVVLAHSPHEESRTAAISGLRSWLVRSPDHRTLLKESLEKTFSPQTEFIVYNLLWGYDTADGRDPTLSAQLVQWLRHEHVAVRELSIYWISELTGQKYSYRPLAPIGTREQGVSSWERHLSRVGALLEAEK